MEPTFVPGQDSLAQFTDGSSLGDATGGGGAAVICCNSNGDIIDTITLPLGKAVSSFCAEVTALKVAIEWLEDTLAHSSHTRQAKVFSDCQQAVSIARTGCVGDSGAYWEATSAIDKSVPSRSFVRRRLNEWKTNTWHVSSKGRHLYALHKNPMLGQPTFHLSLPKKVQVTLSRLRVGNALSNQKKFQLGRSASPDCSNCLGVPDSPEHRILDCPTYHSKRNLLKARCQGCSPFSLSMPELLAPEGTSTRKKKITSAFVAFLVDTKLLDLFNWRPA